MTTSKTTQWLIIGNPENRRVDFLLQQLKKSNEESVSVVSYETLLAEKKLDTQFWQKKISHNTQHLVIKIDSPGENFNVEKALIALGCQSKTSRITPTQARELEFEQGLIRWIPEWFHGFSSLLENIEYSLKAASVALSFKTHYINSPDIIRRAFDKPSMQYWLDQHNFPTTNILDVSLDDQDIVDYDRLKSWLIKNKHFRVFIKLKYGSSASGVIAFQIKPDGSKVKATTSVELEENSSSIKLFNNLKIRTYTQESHIRKIINALIDEQIYVEKWIPKTMVQGHSSDIRMLAIGNSAAHRVLRLSKSPITNLHLGNKRRDFKESSYNDDCLQACEQLVEKVTQTLDNAHNLAFDLVIPQGSTQPRIIEINAFGDLIPNNTFHGKTTQESLIEYVRSR